MTVENRCPFLLHKPRNMRLWKGSPNGRKRRKRMNDVAAIANFEAEYSNARGMHVSVAMPRIPTAAMNAVLGSRFDTCPPMPANCSPTKTVLLW